jgi:hypothetical protein
MAYADPLKRARTDIFDTEPLAELILAEGYPGEKVVNWIRQPKTRAIRIFRRACIAGIALAPIAVIVAYVLPLVLRAQKHVPDQAQCAAREATCGFVGNSDAYGFGIRIGLYLQWVSYVIASITIPKEVRGLGETFVAFSVALFIVLFVLAFQQGCTYLVEIIVLLYLFFGGVLITTVTYFGPQSARESHSVPAVLVAFAFAITPAAVFSCWFWIRFASGHYNPFVTTPCETTFFFFRRIYEPAFKPAGAILVAVSLSLCAFPLTTPFTLLVKKNPTMSSFTRHSIRILCLIVLGFATLLLGGFLALAALLVIVLYIFGFCFPNRKSSFELSDKTTAVL